MPPSGYSTPCRPRLLRILAQRRLNEKLISNDKGELWKKGTVGQRIRWLRRTLQLDEKTVAYAYRHTFATNSLLAGNDLATVAALLGHTDASMVARLYGHLDQHKDPLISAAQRTAAVRHQAG